MADTSTHVETTPKSQHSLSRAVFRQRRSLWDYWVWNKLLSCKGQRGSNPHEINPPSVQSHPQVRQDLQHMNGDGQSSPKSKVSKAGGMHRRWRWNTVQHSTMPCGAGSAVLNLNLCSFHTTPQWGASSDHTSPNLTFNSSDSLYALQTLSSSHTLWALFR